MVVPLAAALAGLALAGCGGDGDAAGEAPRTSGTTAETSGGEIVTVAMRDVSFEPRRVEVATGATVVWENGDDVEHTVTKVAGPGEPFDSQRVPAEYGTFQRDFPEPGTVEYRCEIHPERMRARLVVGDG